MRKGSTTGIKGNLCLYQRNTDLDLHLTQGERIPSLNLDLIPQSEEATNEADLGLQAEMTDPNIAAI